MSPAHATPRGDLPGRTKPRIAPPGNEVRLFILTLLLVLLLGPGQHENHDSSQTAPPSSLSPPMPPTVPSPLASARSRTTQTGCLPVPSVLSRVGAVGPGEFLPTTVLPIQNFPLNKAHGHSGLLF